MKDISSGTHIKISKVLLIWSMLCVWFVIKMDFPYNKEPFLSELTHAAGGVCRFERMFISRSVTQASCPHDYYVLQIVKWCRKLGAHYAAQCCGFVLRRAR